MKKIILSADSTCDLNDELKISMILIIILTLFY